MNLLYYVVYKQNAYSVCKNKLDCMLDKYTEVVHLMHSLPLGRCSDIIDQHIGLWLPGY